MNLVLSIILLSSLSASSNNPTDWNPIGETGRYFDKTNLTIIDKNIVSVWIRYRLSSAEVTRLVDSLKKEKEIFDFSNYNYTMMQEYLNCKERTSAIKHVIHYGKNNKQIISSNYKELDYDKVIPGTIGGESLLEICKYVNRDDSTEMKLFIDK
jgi:hypothetical protein